MCTNQETKIIHRVASISQPRLSEFAIDATLQGSLDVNDAALHRDGDGVGAIVRAKF